MPTKSDWLVLAGIVLKNMIEKNSTIISYVLNIRDLFNIAANFEDLVKSLRIIFTQFPIEIYKYSINK